MEGILENFPERISKMDLLARSVARLFKPAAWNFGLFRERMLFLRVKGSVTLCIFLTFFLASWHVLGFLIPVAR